MICKHILLITSLNEPYHPFLHAGKWFQVLLFNTNYSIQYNPFICSELNGSKYYVSLIVQLTSDMCLHTVKWQNISILNNSI